VNADDCFDIDAPTDKLPNATHFLIFIIFIQFNNLVMATPHLLFPRAD